MTEASALAARIRNLFCTGKLSKRDGDGVQGTTRFGRTVEDHESHPYGFASRAESGTMLFLFEGGDVRSPVMLYVTDQNGVPDLKNGDSALWTKKGGWIVCRNDGSVELFGKDSGGLVKGKELKSQLDKNSQILQTLLAVLKTPVPEPGNGSPSAFQAALNSALAGKTPGDFSQIESDKVFHGTGGA